MASENSKQERPLSPHLQVYKPQMTSMLSILHRATGVFMITGLLVITWWLIAASSGSVFYDQFLDVASSKVGILFTMGWSFCYIYHFVNGIRHLIWDTGRLFGKEAATKAGYVVFWGAVVLTGALWAGIFTKGVFACLY